MLLAAFRMLSTGGAFRDLGEGYLDQVARKRPTTKPVESLGNLGYDVMPVPEAAQPASPSVQGAFPQQYRKV